MTLPDNNIDKVRTLENRRCQAMTTSDVPLLSQLFSDDLVWIHSSAKVDDKQSFLASIHTGKIRYTQVVCSEQQIRLFGDIAIVCGIVALEAIANGAVKKAVNRFTCIWSIADSKLLSWQSTSL